MFSMQDLIDDAKTKIQEEVEFQLAPINIETEMQNKGILAQYAFNNDIIYYSVLLMKSQNVNWQIGN